MTDEPLIPEGLTKRERKKFKREFYHRQMDKQIQTGTIKKYFTLTIVFLLVITGGYWLVKELTKPKPGEYVPSLGNKHIQNITDPHEKYNSVPPTSGTHVNGKAQWGISENPIADELQIHNLEDGGVMAQYNCIPGKETQDDCGKLIKNLTNIVDNYTDKVVLAPYPDLDSQIALTAWTRIDKFNDFDRERIEKFIKAFQGIDHH